MLIKAILKEIKIKNNDTDTYSQLVFDVYLDKVDKNELYEMKLQELNLNLTKSK